MKKFLAIALAAVMLFSLAACGGNTDTENNEVVKVINVDITDEKYAFGIDKDQPELLEKTNAFIAKIMEDGTFDEICKKYFEGGEKTAIKSAEPDASKDQLIVATNANFAPFEYMEGDSYYGIDMEIAALLAEYLGQELVISNMKFDSVCLSVGQHKCDIAMAGLTINEERLAYVTFSDSYYTASQKIIVKADDTTFDACADVAAVEEILNSFDETTKIGYQNGTTAQFYTLGDEGWNFPGYKATGVGYDNGSLAVQDLINGNINLVIIDAEPAVRITENMNAMA